MAVRMFRHGDKCVLYNLSFCNVWKDWDSIASLNSCAQRRNKATSLSSSARMLLPHANCSNARPSSDLKLSWGLNVYASCNELSKPINLITKCISKAKQIRCGSKFSWKYCLSWILLHPLTNLTFDLTSVSLISLWASFGVGLFF